jgi:carbon-monoxide dehydrogenase medium subunit/6-hydroxypseudooxynicotine dehydrogenase subunit alpha
VKPAVFAYHDPGDLESALKLLAANPNETKVLAGGQSLVPLMNFRLARPEIVVDINRLTELAYIRPAGQGLAIGALTRHSQLARSQLVAERCPVLVEAILYVGHMQIRNRGTVGGSVMHADPAAELPCAFAALEAQFHLASIRGRRVLTWGEMFEDVFTTAARPDEILVEIEVPPLPPRTGHAFVEFARRTGDFALGGACALLTVDGSGRCLGARLSLLAAGPKPTRAVEAENLLAGGSLNEAELAAAAARATAGLSPAGDLHGSTGYRVDLLETMARRALGRAAERAREQTP